MRAVNVGPDADNYMFLFPVKQPIQEENTLANTNKVSMAHNVLDSYTRLTLIVRLSVKNDSLGRKTENEDLSEWWEKTASADMLPLTPNMQSRRRPCLSKVRNIDFLAVAACSKPTD